MRICTRRFHEHTFFITLGDGDRGGFPRGAPACSQHLARECGYMQPYHLCSLSCSLLQVDPVLRGYRITLAYELTADTDPRTRSLQVSESGTPVSPMLAAFMRAPDEPEFLPEGRPPAHLQHGRPVVKTCLMGAATPRSISQGR